nr:Chain Q, SYNAPTOJANIN 1 [Homo sapiens]
LDGFKDSFDLQG